MRIGAAGRKHAVRQVDMQFTGRNFRKLRLSFRAPDGQITDLELTRAQAFSFFDWAYAESTQFTPVERVAARKLAGGAVAVPPA
jgi:hypothetical protein